MIPIKLSLEGIYSYQKRQEIDFSELTNAGLFGIFGKVGSGKSSILEAISYAIYGETERMNSREKRSYNMLNLKSKQAFISLEFTNFENRIFRIDRELKRSSSNFEEVKTSVQFYEFLCEKWIPLEHSDGEKIIGISYENFKRTIIIPQGKFREFLELTASGRTKMMKELFGLQRYDLSGQTTLKSNENKEKLNFVKGKLDVLEETNEEKIQQLEEKSAEIATEKSNIEKKFLGAEKDLRNAESIKTDAENLAKKKNYHQNLQEKLPEIKALETKTDLYENAEKNFSPLFSKKSDQEISLKNLAEKNNEQEKIYAETVKLLGEVELKISAVKSDAERLPKNRKAERDLGLLAQNAKLQDEISAQKSRIEKGNFELGNLKKSAEENAKKTTEISEEIKNLNAKKIDSAVLFDLGKWYQDDANFTENLAKNESSLGKISKQISEIQTKKTELKNQIESLASEPENLIVKLQELAQIKTQLQVQQRITEFSHELHNGEPCPLCGSENHPKISVHEDVSNQISATETQISDLEKTIKSVEKIQNELTLADAELKNIFTQKSEIEQEIFVINEAKKKHLEGFIWKDFTAENPEKFHERKNDSLATEKMIAEKSAELENLKQIEEKSTKKMEKFSDELWKIESKIASRNAVISANQNNLEVIDFKIYTEKPESEITAELEFLHKKNNDTEKNYAELTKNLQDLDTKKDGAMQAKNIFLEQISTAKENLNKLQDALQNQLENSDFASEESVLEILKNPENIQQNRQEISSFYFEKKQTEKEIAELETKLNGAEFSEENFQNIKKTYEDSKINFQKISEDFTKNQLDLQRLQLLFQRKKELQKEITELEKRQSNLDVLKKLFTGEGFVQYVSSVYLHQLCNLANQRFHKMTRNSLSLFLNDQNDFEVIDYLNEGRHRSVKTLSGGQSFQASLCLALALAENIQTHSKTGKNFFFIDEGFGTQDSDSVQIIFETLQGLLKENRIVGIISHVEELKEQIPTSILVQKNEEKGSQITVI